MPLIFSSAVQAVFFWIFLGLFVAACITALFFLKKIKAGLFAAALFLSLALVCLVPRHPLIYCACLLFSLSLLGQAFEKYPLKLCLSAAGALGQGFLLTQVLSFLSLPYPFWMIPLPALLFVGVERLLRRAFKKSEEFSLRLANVVLYALPIALCGVLLVAGSFYYAAFLILFGYFYLLGETAAPAKEEERIFGRNFFKAAFLLIGAFLVFFGLSLYVAA